MKSNAMRHWWTAFIIISIGLIPPGYGFAREFMQSSSIDPHRFSPRDCEMCHVDVDNNPGNLKLMSNSRCVGCHADLKSSQLHPVDISTNILLPDDMPLVNGRLGCITCHFVHPFSDRYKNRSGNLLRRPGRGAFFCGACHHGIDGKGHVVYENIHRNSYRLSAINSSLDSYTLQCVECHDSHLDRSFGSDSAGKGSRFNRRSNHPVGVSLARIAARNPLKFNPPCALPQNVRLFNGKIGCGTCHNAFSKEKSMLVMNNWRSRLCLRCHIK
jgi:predicted CXXCH cytochrome family protein